MSLQIQRFPDGGGVIHRIPHPRLPGVRISAWSGPDGSLLDCEAHRNGKPVRVAADARLYAASVLRSHFVQPVILP